MFKNYEILEQRKITDLNSEGYILRHKKTGARVTMLLNDDENKVFYIGFRTPPTDSTGVAHILEHCVLCGSEKYPVKDPFIELAKGSLNTFLNAMTYSDKTVYPVASCNEQDFRNLMDVYLDAVFHPNIYREEKIFRQEGHHYEITEEDGELTINGVVYNEMKGAFSSPDDVVEREIMNSLYPDVTYGLESGGDPDVIPSLTYEEFLDFHAKYYHPSNSYIYLYGNLDPEKYLSYLDEEYLSHYDQLDVDSGVGFQKPFDAPKRVLKEYPVLEGDESAETYLTCNYCLGTSLDRELYIAIDVLDYVLLTAPGAIIRQALLDAGIGDDVYSAMETGIYQPYFGIIAKNAKKEDEGRFLSIIEEKLKETVKNGLPKKALLAALTVLEFKYRESDFGSYPRGLMLGLQALDSWLYDDEKPFLHIEANETYRYLKEQIDTGYFEELIRKYFLENTHRSLVLVAPKENLTAIKDEELREKLAAYKASLSEEEVRKLIRETNELKKYQEEPDDPEDIKKIPMLKRSDLRKEGYHTINEERDASGTKVIMHDLFTNGIVYLTTYFELERFPAELISWIGILKIAFGLVDTEHYSYNELYNEINITTGGLSMDIRTLPLYHEREKVRRFFYVRTKVLKDKRKDALSLIREILMTSKFEDHKRLQVILTEAKVRLQAALVSSGHQTALGRALSYLSENYAIDEQLNGVEFYRFLCDLTEHFDEKKELITGKLHEAAEAIFRPENLIASVTCDEEGYEGLEDLITDWKQTLYTTPCKEGRMTASFEKKNEGFKTAGLVQYVCRAGLYSKKDLPYTGALRVLRVILSYDYLWKQVRVLGGAYGCMVSLSKDGSGVLVSYRDPKLKETVDVFENVVSYVRDLELDERQVTQYIIGALAELDMPQTPCIKGNTSFNAYITGFGDKEYQKERDELLGVDEEILRGLSIYLETILADEALCVVGNAENVESCRELFGSVSQLA
ncbi:MAG: insulinase family protein [Lachnospiraceae bacterium]|nr:insulinase family protein [Lachnospiraceae bacterium]